MYFVTHEIFPPAKINNNHNIRVQIVHNSVDFEALRAHVVSTTLPYPPIKETEFTPQDIEDLLKDIDYNPSLDVGITQGYTLGRID